MEIPVARLDEVLDWACQQLSSKLPFDEASLDAELLLSDSLNKSRTWLKTWPEHELSSSQKQAFAESVTRRLAGEPVAYILGHQEFWSLKLQVTEDTLIPRPETELLVELALDKISSNSSVSIADLGTGTGAIALAVASERPKATVYAVDYSEKALAVAEHNRQQLVLDNVKTVHNSWLENWRHGLLDLIVSNPPYVAPGDPHLTDLQFEPYAALVAADDGYADILTIATQAKQWLNPNGYLLFEHGFEQAKGVANILERLGYSDIVSVKDLSGQDRVTLGKLPNKNC